ncbi:TPA: hypothetical protein ACJMKH_003370 [Bacillus wiedmannii]
MGHLIKGKSEMIIVEKRMESLLKKVYQGDKEALEKLNKIKKAMVSN